MSSPEQPPPFEPAAAWQQPSAPVPGWPPPGEPAPRAIRLPVITGVAGLAAGALVVGMLWLGTTLAGDPDTGTDGRMACDILDRLPELTPANLDDTYAARLQAAGNLAAVATADDNSYQPVADNVRAALQALQFNDADTAGTSLETARQNCADR